MRGRVWPVSRRSGIAGHAPLARRLRDGNTEWRVRLGKQIDEEETWYRNVVEAGRSGR